MARKKKEGGIIDYLIYAGFVFLLIYLVLKMAGVIQAPQYLAVAPELVAVLLALGVFRKIDKIDETIVDMDKRLVRVEERTKSL